MQCPDANDKGPGDTGRAHTAPCSTKRSGRTAGVLGVSVVLGMSALAAVLAAPAWEVLLPFAGVGAGVGILAVVVFRRWEDFKGAMEARSKELKREFEKRSNQITGAMDEVRKQLKQHAKQAKPPGQPRSAADLRFQQLLAESQIRELPLAAIFPGIDEVAIPVGAINPETGHTNQAEFLFVCALAAHRRCRSIFEIGTFLGRTTYHLALACPDARVYTLDLPEDLHPRPGPAVGAYFKGTQREGQITQLRCDSSAFDPAPYRGNMDFIWVDGDHTFSLVKNDTEKALEMLAPGGVILWHDYAPKTIEVVEFFREFTRTRPVFRIKDTSILLLIDGVDPMRFEPHPLRVSKSLVPTFKAWEAAKASRVA